MEPEWEDRPPEANGGEELPLAGLLEELLAGAGAGGGSARSGGQDTQSGVEEPLAPADAAGAAAQGGSGAEAAAALSALSEFGGELSGGSHPAVSDMLLARLLEESGPALEQPALTGPAAGDEEAGEEFTAQPDSAAGLALTARPLAGEGGAAGRAPGAGEQGECAAGELPAPGGPCAEEPGAGASARHGEPQDGGRRAASAGAPTGPPPAAQPDEADDFELVDADTAEKMLDRLIHAARTAIQAPLQAAAGLPPDEQAGAGAYAGSPPAEESRAAAPGAVPVSGIGNLYAALAPEPSAGAEMRVRPAGPERPENREGAGLPAASAAPSPPPEGSPLPSMAALMAMGLPERLRTRLEQVGDPAELLLASDTKARGEETRERYVVFRVGEQSYGLHMQHVREVERVGRVTQVPGAPAFVSGLVNLRGEILPLVDAHALLGGKRPEAPANAKLIVAQADAQEPPLALLVDELGGLALVDQADVEPPAGDLGPDLAGRVTGAAVHRGRRVLFLNPGAVFGQAAIGQGPGEGDR